MKQESVIARFLQFLRQLFGRQEKPKPSRILRDLTTDSGLVRLLEVVREAEGAVSTYLGIPKRYESTDNFYILCDRTRFKAVPENRMRYRIGNADLLIGVPVDPDGSGLARIRASTHTFTVLQVSNIPRSLDGIPHWEATVLAHCHYHLLVSFHSYDWAAKIVAERLARLLLTDFGDRIDWQKEADQLFEQWRDRF